MNDPGPLFGESLASNLPNHGRVEANFAVLAGLSRGLSGGDILNISLNAIHAGSTDTNPAKWKVMQEMLLTEIKQVRKAKEEHSGVARRQKRAIGFR